MREIAPQEATMTEATMNKSAPSQSDVREQLERVLAEVARLSGRVAGLETQAAAAASQLAPAKIEAAASLPIAEAAQSNAAVAEAANISEEELLAISAALAAWLGVQPHIRQIRLIRSSAWAQQGRVTIQTSHGLYH